MNPFKKWFGGKAAAELETDRLPHQWADSERLHQWYQSRPPEERERERAEVELVRSRFRDAAAHRRAWEQDAVLACAAVEGRQWLGWDNATHRAISLMRGSHNERVRYITHNLIRPMVAKMLGLATATNPDATPAPETESEMDRLATSEARAICGHLSREGEGKLQTLDMAFWAVVAGAGYLRQVWNPSAKAAIPRYGMGPDGQPALMGRVDAPVGELEEHVVSPFEIFIDPSAKRYRDARWIIYATMKPLSYFVETYGDRGKLVQPDSATAASGYASAYLSDELGGISQLGSWAETGQNHAALCLEMWEKPTPAHPQGRVRVIGGEILLTPDLPWYFQWERFPFARMAFEEAVEHPYGRGIVAELVPLNQELNRMLTKTVVSIEDNKPTLIRHKLSGSGADAFGVNDDNRAFREVWVNQGSGLPVWQQQLPVTSDVWRYMDQAWLHMQHIAGIHDVNMGGVPAGVTTGIGIALLQEGDQRQLSGFTHRIEQYAVTRDKNRIANYAQFASPYIERLMGLDESGNPDTARRKAMAFVGLTSGGSVDVLVTPGSATPRSQAGRQQFIFDLYDKGMFGPPGTPEAAMIAVQLLEFAGSDQVIEGLKRIEEKMAATAEAERQAVMDAQREQIALEAEAEAAVAGAKAQATLQTDLVKQQQQSELTVEEELLKRVMDNLFPQQVPNSR